MTLLRLLCFILLILAQAVFFHFSDSQEQLSRERHFWEEASGAHGFQFNHDSKLIHRGLQKISELSFEEVRKEGSCLYVCM